MRKLALFDLDGTINTSKARNTLIPENVRDNASWLPWHKAFRMERLNLGLIKTAAAYSDAGFIVSVVSNRDNSLITDTCTYLHNSGFPDARYHFRFAEDNRHPSTWKEQTVRNLLAYIGPVEVHHFDDDKKALDRLADAYRHSLDVKYIPHLVKWE